MQKFLYKNHLKSKGFPYNNDKNTKGFIKIISKFKIKCILMSTK